MSAVFADTFYWIALTAPQDAAHGRASRFKGEIVTTEEVLAEYLNFFSAAPQHLRLKVATAAEAILASPDIRVIPQSHESFSAGLDLYRGRPDKCYSLTDCISMQTMRREGLIEALTDDRHFEQDGFRALFR